jgi:uncharacterized Tic20 family protein
MNERVSLKLRMMAAAIQITGAIPAGITVVLISIYISPLRAIKGIDTVLIWAAIIISILSCSIWMITRNIDRFVDRSRQDAINCMLSSSLGIIFSLVLSTFIISFIFSITCGIGELDPISLFLKSIPVLLVMLISCIVAIGYFTNSMVATIFALIGYHFESILIYPFIRAE